MTPEDLARRIADLDERLRAAERELASTREELRRLEASVGEERPPEHAAPPPAEEAAETPTAATTGDVVERDAVKRDAVKAVDEPEPVLEAVEAPATPAAGERHAPETPPVDVDTAPIEVPHAEVAAAAAGPEKRAPSEPAVAASTAAPGAATGEGESRPGRGIDYETRVGAVWFNRIGLVALVIGFVLLARFLHPRLEPWHKVAGFYLASAVLFAIGRFFEQSLRQFARPVMAGALALAFFTSFAAHFLPATACVPMWVSLVLMTLSVLAVLLCAERWRSEPAAGLAIFLGFVAAYVAAGDADVFSLVAILFLSATACFLIVRHDWMPLGGLVVAAAHLTHLLWAFAEHPESTPEKRFWVNFAFLAAYYAIFLVGDVVHRHRVWRRGADAFTRAQRVAGRALGPAAAVLHATFVAALFHETVIYWSVIHFWLAPLALLQAGLLVYHWRRGNPDFPIYGATAVTFATLAMFSWLGGLTLNLALAAEALVLFLLARQLRLWFLNPLAQAALAVNFVHYWMSPASVVDAWPVYIGSLSTALVYLVKSWLEVTWTPRAPDEDEPESMVTRFLREVCDVAMRPLAYVHAVLGGVLLIHATFDFVPEPWDGLALAGFAVALATATLRFRGGPFALAVWVVQGGSVSALALHISGVASLELWSDGPLWLLEQLVSIAHLAAALLVLGGARACGRTVLVVQGAGSLLLALGASALALFIGYPTEVWWPVWLVVPVATFAVAEVFEKFYPARDVATGAFDRVARAGSTPFRHLLAILGGLLTWRAALEVITDVHSALWFLATAPAVLLGVAARRGSVVMLSALAVLALLVDVTLIDVSLVDVGLWSRLAGAVPPEPFQVWWIATAHAVVAAALVASFLGHRSAWFPWGGVVFLGCFVALGFALLLIDAPVSGTVEWLVAVGIALATAELLRVVSWVGAPASGSLLERRVFAVFARSATGIGVVAAAFIALLLAAIAVHCLDGPGPASWLLLGAMALIFAAAAWWRSPILGAAWGVSLLALHGLYALRIGPSSGALAWPWLSFAIVFGTIACGVVSELAFRRSVARGGDDSQRHRAAALACFPYVLAFVLAGPFLAEHGELLFGEGSAKFPYLLGLAVLAFVAGSRLRLGWFEMTGLIYAVVSLAALVVSTSFTPDLRHDYFLAGLVVFAELVVLERVVTLQDESILGGRRERDIIGGVAVAAAAVTVLHVLITAEGIRSTWTTLGWSVAGLVLMSLGFLWKSRAYRLSALGVFCLAIARIAVVDIVRLSPGPRILAFLGLGASLILVSFFYARFRRQFERWF